ncbi:MAG: rod shape-determining protein MreC [Bacteroidetes bacterium]|nr:rod shape-determining protein MreC [Bacteroidota bacterium]
MRNVFLFIRRYFNFLFFLVLQIISLVFLFRYNKFHQAAFANLAGEITGRIDEKYNNIEYYFQLKNTNEALVKENLRLHQQLKENYEGPDIANKTVTDTFLVDSLKKIEKFVYREAKVVSSSIFSQTNYLTIHRGAAQQIRPNMGVISPQGIVGTVISTSQNFAVVMSMLHKQYTVVVKLKNGGERGKIEWDGVSPSFVTLRDIPKSAKLNKGDSIVTSETSSLFPPGILVGTVDEVEEDNSSNFYTVKVKTATNFFNVEYVYVIDNIQYEEQKNLEDSTHKKMQ